MIDRRAFYALAQKQAAQVMLSPDTPCQRAFQDSVWELSPQSLPMPIAKTPSRRDETSLSLFLCNNDTPSPQSAVLLGLSSPSTTRSGHGSPSTPNHFIDVPHVRANPLSPLCKCEDMNPPMPSSVGSVLPNPPEGTDNRQNATSGGWDSSVEVMDRCSPLQEVSGSAPILMGAQISSSQGTSSFLSSSKPQTMLLSYEEDLTMGQTDRHCIPGKVDVKDGKEEVRARSLSAPP